MLVMLCLLGMQALASHAAGIHNVRVAAAEESSFANAVAVQVLSLLKNSLPTISVERHSLTALKSLEPDTLLVLIGESAASEMMGVDTGRTPLLLVAPQRVTTEWAVAKGFSSPSPWATIQLEQPLPRILNLTSLVDVTTKSDQAKVVGVLISSTMQKKLSALEVAANERNLKLRAEVVENELAVGPAVARLVNQSGILLALPDPLVHTPNTVQPILLLSYRAGVPVIAYSAAYLRAGATLVLYSSPEQIARQVVETITAMRVGKPVPSLQAPRYFTVGANTAVARSLSLDLPSPTVLEERLRLMKE